MKEVHPASLFARLKNSSSCLGSCWFVGWETRSCGNTHTHTHVQTWKRACDRRDWSSMYVNIHAWNTNACTNTRRCKQKNTKRFGVRARTRGKEDAWWLIPFHREPSSSLDPSAASILPFEKYPSPLKNDKLSINPSFRQKKPPLPVRGD